MTSTLELECYFVYFIHFSLQNHINEFPDYFSVPSVSLETYSYNVQ
jgi:hypothetical protein